MRSPLRAASSDTSYSISLPAPVGGWNVADPVANMPKMDAIILNNMFPTENDVRVRPGCRHFASVGSEGGEGGGGSGSGFSIQSLMTYKNTAGVGSLFAGCADGIYAITEQSVASIPVTPATSARWQSVNISTAGGSFLWCCNGVDNARYFDGTDWTILTDLPAAPGQPSLDPKKITNVTLFKSRLYLTERDSLSFWFLAPNSIAGEASEFPLGAVFQRGGYLVAVNTWTLDGGNGMDDYFVLITSEGELAVYKGYDPSSAANWGLVGVFQLARPVSYKCFTRFGGDLLIFTEAGLVPLSAALQSVVVEKNASISRKVETVLKEASQLYRSNFGWEIILFPSAPFVLLNIPLGTLTSFQCVMNTTTGAWTRFTNWNATCWGLLGGRLLYAVGSEVYEAWVGGTDNGAAIQAEARTAYNYLNSRGTGKRITLARPSFTISREIYYKLSVTTDFSTELIRDSEGKAVVEEAIWDTALWDSAYWAGLTTSARWQTVSHVAGRAFSIGLRMSVQDSTVYWNSTDIIAEGGGLL